MPLDGSLATVTAEMNARAAILPGCTRLLEGHRALLAAEQLQPPSSRRELIVADVVDPATRSRMMASIGPKNTRPEILVRRYLHGAGLRFRLHAEYLPGTPDVVMTKYHAAVFVHGCFWHRHSGCKYAATPKTRVSFWTAKFAANVGRDFSKADVLRSKGWRVFLVWECEANDELALDALFWQIVSIPTEAATTLPVPADHCYNSHM